MVMDGKNGKDSDGPRLCGQAILIPETINISALILRGLCVKDQWGPISFQ